MKTQRINTTRHIIIENAEDLLNATAADPALWMTLSAPAQAFALDTVFIRHLSDASDQRIIYDRVMTEIQWLIAIFQDHSLITAQKNTLDGTTLNPNHPDGNDIIDTLNEINSGSTVELTDIRDHIDKTMQYSVSQTGVITSELTSREDLKTFIALAVEITGGCPHPNGQIGIDQTLLAQALDTLDHYLNWKQQYQIAIDNHDQTLLPCGDETLYLYQQFLLIKPKLDQYFNQCTSLRFIQSLEQPIEIDRLKPIGWQSTESLDAFLKDAPLAYPRVDGILKLNDSLNPHYAQAIIQWINKLTTYHDCFPKNQLSEQDYHQICALFSAFKKWYDNNPSASLDHYAIETLEGLLNPSYQIDLEQLIAQGEITKQRLRKLQLLEKALLYQQLMIPFARNYIGLTEIYSPKPTCFEKGQLIMNGYHFHFAILVPDIAEHKRLSADAQTFLLYVSVLAPQPYNIVVPVTQGNKSGFIKGKRGVFIDSDDNKYDAIVIDIVTQPINLKEAIIEPFAKFKNIFEKKIDDDNLIHQKKLLDAGENITKPNNVMPSRPNINLNPSTLIMGGGIAIAALSSSLVYIISTIASASYADIIITVAVLLGLLLIPTTIAGVVKLKKRDIRPILEGSSWALNRRMRLTKKVARMFTVKPKH